MGTHPIFESDFDCLTDYKSALNKMAFTAGAKIFKDAGETVSDVEQQLSQALVEVENNAAADLKAPLKELYFKNAREFDVGSGRKAIAIFVPFPQLKSWQKIQQKVVRELEKKFSEKNLDTTRLLKIHLDKTMQTDVEHKLETFGNVYKKL